MSLCFSSLDMETADLFGIVQFLWVFHLEGHGRITSEMYKYSSLGGREKMIMTLVRFLKALFPRLPEKNLTYHKIIDRCTCGPFKETVIVNGVLLPSCVWREYLCFCGVLLGIRNYEGGQQASIITMQKSSCGSHAAALEPQNTGPSLCHQGVHD